MLHLLKKAPAMPALLLSSDSPKLREAYNRIRTNLDARLRGIADAPFGSVKALLIYPPHTLYSRYIFSTTSSIGVDSTETS